MGPAAPRGGLSRRRNSPDALLVVLAVSTWLLSQSRARIDRERLVAVDARATAERERQSANVALEASRGRQLVPRQRSSRAGEPRAGRRRRYDATERSASGARSRRSMRVKRPFASPISRRPFAARSVMPASSSATRKRQSSSSARPRNYLNKRPNRTPLSWFGQLIASPTHTFGPMRPEKASSFTDWPPSEEKGCWVRGIRRQPMPWAESVTRCWRQET